MDDTPTTALAADPLTGRILDRRYEVGPPLARGGMATVYAGTDTRLDREVAIKVMHPAFAHDPEFVTRFEREAKSAARINDPHVVAVHDTGIDGTGRDRVVYLVMELVRGPTLRELLGRRGPLSPSRALGLIEAVLQALAAAHRAGLVHRDVKPENVLLSDGGTVKVADFGLVRSIEGSALTGAVILGTVAYLAPEQVGRGEVTAATDVYAAGICLYEMLTGEVPYSGDDPRAVAFRRLHEQVPAPSMLAPGLPPGLDALVARATASDPADRFADAAAFLTAVHAEQRLPPSAPVIRGGDTSALPLDEHLTQVLVPPPNKPGRGAVPAKPRRRRRRLVFALLFLLLCAAVTVGAWQYGAHQDVSVPSLKGLTLTEATAALHSHHLEARTGDATYDDAVPIDRVVASTPGDGKDLSRGSAVTLHLSKGVQILVVPDLVRQDAAAATAALGEIGLPVGTTTSQYHDTVPAGQVITTLPTAGASVDHRTTVTLIVSRGPAPVALPDLTGKPQAQALAILKSLGLRATVVDAVYDDAVASGSVVRQTPPAGTLHRGDAVALTPSKGPEFVSVPELSGKTAAQAQKMLSDLGLEAQERDLFGYAGRVVAQSPADGKVRAGTTVVFYTA